MIESFLTDSEEAVVAISSDVEKNIWINGKTTLVYTGEDYTPPGEVAGLLDQVVEVIPVKVSKKAKAEVVQVLSPQE